MSDLPENNEFVISVLEEWLTVQQSDDEMLSVAEWGMEMLAHLKAARKGDCNGDGWVDVSDLSILSGNFRKQVR